MPSKILVLKALATSSPDTSERLSLSGKHKAREKTDGLQRQAVAEQQVPVGCLASYNAPWQAGRKAETLSPSPCPQQGGRASPPGIRKQEVHGLVCSKNRLASKCNLMLCKASASAFAGHLHGHSGARWQLLSSRACPCFHANPAFKARTAILSTHPKPSREFAGEDDRCNRARERAQPGKAAPETWVRFLKAPGRHPANRFTSPSLALPICEKGERDASSVE